MESEKLSCSGLYWLCKEAENRSSAADSPAAEVPTPPAALEPDSKAEGMILVEEAPPPAAGEKRRRGRPARGEGRAAAAAAPAKRMKKKKEDEDVCFICFDGGSLVLCDRGDCPKAYHPACIKRDEAFFRSKAKWNCGWHICSKCQKSSARYMCYTCTYSLCKGCTRDSDYLCVRENKGFCSTCFRVVKMIENIDQENVETVQVDFDDKLSWEYLFKVYWICLKRDLSLTLDEITRAQKPWTAAPTKVTRREKYPAVYYPGNSENMTTVNPTVPNNAISYTSVKSVRENNTTFIVSTSWASKELLDFAAYMRNGDTSALSQKEVQALLFDYIKRNNLRDPHQRSEIICDSKLEKLFGKPRVRHFEMLSLLEFHFLTKDEIHGDIINPAVRQVAGESKSDNLPMISENYTNKIDKMDEGRVDINRSHEIKNTCEKLDKHVDSSGSTNNGPKNQACPKSDSFSGVKSETSVASLSTGSTPSANDREAENSWHYRDPNGKVQGPFSIEQLNKWSTTAIFPLDMKIWRLNTEERDSVLLTDVIKDQIRLQNNLSLSPQDAKGTSESTNSVGIDTDAHSNGKLEMIEGNGRVLNSSNGKIPKINNDPQIKNDAKINNSSVCLDLEQPKVVNSNLNQPEDNNDARNKNSSKYIDPEKSKVVNSYLNQPQVINDTQITISSKCRESELPKGVNSNLNQPEVNNDDQIKSVSKCQEPEKTKVINSNLNQPQVNNDDTLIKNSSKCPVPEQFKVVNTNLNQTLVKNDARIKKSSKCREPNKTKVVNSDLNQPQVKNDTRIKKSSKRRDRDQTKVVNSNLNQPQDNSDARIKNSLKYRDQTKAVNSNSNLLQEKNNTQIKNSSVCWDPEPPKVVTSNLNQPLVENDTQINNSSNCLEPEQPKTVNSYMNQPLVKNDTQINNSSKCREPEQPKVVDSHINQPQINGDTVIKNFSKFQEPDLTKVVNPNLNQPEVHDDAQMKSSSIFWDLEQPKVVNPNLNQPQVNDDAPVNNSSKFWDPEPSKFVNPNLNQPQVNDNARVNNFSKFWDPEPPKVVNPNLNQPQFNDNSRVNNSSKFWDSEPPKVVNPNLNQPQVNNDARVNNSSKFWDPEPSNVVNSNFNQPQVNSDTHIKNSSKCWEPEQPKVVTSFLNQAQVHNDTQIKNSSKYWDSEPSRAAVDPYLNQPQVHSMVRSSPLEENPHENIVHQERNKMGHMWNPSPNYENWSSQGNMISQTTGKQFHEIQINEQHYLRQNPSANSWNSDESRPHYTAMANLADSSQQKFSINLQDFPMPMPKISSRVSEDQTIKEQQRWPPPQISVQNIGIHNMLSLTPKSIDHDEKDYFRNQKITSDFEKVRASDNKHSLSSKPSMMEWNSDFLSVCSTSKNDELPPPSPPNPVPNASSWLAMMTEPIEFNTLAEESVSDLLAEVDAMESNSDMESPNMLMDYADDLFQDSKTDCFISLRGFISPHDRVKEEALCSSGDTPLATLQSNFSDEKIRAPNNDFPIDLSKKSKKHSSSTSSVMEVETKRFDNIPDNRHNLSPPKKIRDLADIMNAPAKHGNLNSTGRELGQGTPRGSGNKKRSTTDGISGGRESSHQKHGGEREKLTSPRERNGSNALISPRDRNVSGGRPSWSRQSSFGGGSGNNNSRSIPRGQRVCKFYESGYCRKGAICDYLHP